MFCFHGLGDDSRYWGPFFEAMRRLSSVGTARLRMLSRLSRSVGLALAGATHRAAEVFALKLVFLNPAFSGAGLRVVGVDAPRRLVWGESSSAHIVLL